MSWVARVQKHFRETVDDYVKVIREKEAKDAAKALVELVALFEMVKNAPKSFSIHWSNGSNWTVSLKDDVQKNIQKEKEYIEQEYKKCISFLEANPEKKNDIQYKINT